MLVYRITRAKYGNDLSGAGAARSTINRWNSKGTQMVYTAESEGLARAELSGHINLSMLQDPVVITIHVPDHLIDELDEIPNGFDEIPPGQETKMLGDQFVAAQKFLALKVPSRYDVQSRNVLLNPQFPAFDEHVEVIEIRPLKKI